MSKCTGQDRQQWNQDDIFEINCSHCGSAVEFFKDDPTRRCRTCGARIANPKILQGCAQWCNYARECLGFDPKALTSTEPEHLSMADKLIEAVKAEFGSDQKRITHALMVLEHAEQIMGKEGGSARVVIGSALLHDIGIQQAQRKHGWSTGHYQEIEGPPIARRILEQVGFDPETIDHVARIVGSHHSGGDIDTLEFRIIWDADNLVNLAETLENCDKDSLERTIAKTFRTEAGKGRARELFMDDARKRPKVQDSEI